MLEYEMLPSAAKHPVKTGFSQIVCLGQWWPIPVWVYLGMFTLNNLPKIKYYLEKCMLVKLTKCNFVYYLLFVGLFTLHCTALGSYTTSPGSFYQGRLTRRTLPG